MCARQEVYHGLGDSQENLARSDDVTKCGSDSPTVNELLMSREAPASITLAVVQWY